VTIAASKRLAIAGSTVTITGRVVERGVAGTGRTVLAQERVHGTRTWHTFSKVRASTSGRVVVRHAVRRSKDFRLRAAVAGVVRTSAVTTVTVPTSIAVGSTSDRTPVAGAPLTISGTTSAGLTGARVFLQLRTASGWSSVSSARVAGDASYTVRAVATFGGDQLWRAYVPAAAGRAAAVTAPVDFTVYAWYRLADRMAAASSGSPAPLAANRLVIAGTPYADALGTALTEGSTTRTSFALQHRCLSFRTVIGATDDSAPGFYGVFRLLADDDVAIDQVLDKGSTRQVEVDLTGADVLRLSSTALTGDGDPAWGNPEVLCAGF
jgi:hypothetical protein